ncbi:PAS domain-containing protein [Hahella sp. KA22]|uniref:sensor histidine kinase n=1 Tax=Hahella sp. KA22 TaxID=1628392 RepID=UPI000FDF2EE2|nr:ATP-binding protein [Hahella sp. KA22]AZZ90964.1 PAS domain-containing protein [Hahella sp. KA22]QAY54334.1 PAS domain-containing protein [Hahella sp. KA22]
MSVPKILSPADQEQPVAVIHHLAPKHTGFDDGAYAASADPGLDRAMSMFGAIADQISQTYQDLSGRVNRLANELDSVSVNRQREFEDKAHIANRLKTLLQALPVGIVVLDARGSVQECNPAAVDLLGEPLQGERWVEIIQRCFAPKADDGHEVSLKDGRRLSIQTCSLENAPGQLIVLSDLTETRELQSRLSRSERLSSMGRMVASLAHQIRTPLSAAMLYAGHLSQPELDGSLRVKCAQKLMSRLTHLEQQVRDMLIFAKGDAPLAQRITCEELFSEIQAAAEPEAQRKQAPVQWSIDCGEREILCNKDALVGAVLNLFNNALEAVKSADQPQVEVNLSAPGQGFICLEVRDNGVGFDPEDGPRLLEAFYTTKSHGTGLGLAVAQGVAQAHHGRFFITSGGPGLGARAILTLPARHSA